MLNDSVCKLPLPDQDSKGRHPMSGALASGLGALWQETHSTAVIAIAKREQTMASKLPWGAGCPACSVWGYFSCGPQSQNSSFSANWTCREGAAAVMAPAEGLTVVPENVIGLGDAKFA